MAMSPDSIKYTSFVTLLGQFEYIRIPFKNWPPKVSKIYKRGNVGSCASKRHSHVHGRYIDSQRKDGFSFKNFMGSIHCFS